MFNQLFIHEWLARRRDNVLLFSTSSSAKQSALSKKKDVTKSIEE